MCSYTVVCPSLPLVGAGKACALGVPSSSRCRWVHVFVEFLYGFEAPPGVERAKDPVVADAMEDDWGCVESAPRSMGLPWVGVEHGMCL